MQGQHKDVVKNITSAAQLESELQISQAQHGVAVLDVYNAEWGHTKALSETFRLLHTNAGDAVHLRFFSVECNAVIESLQDPEDKKKALMKPKGLQPAPDTLSSFWASYVESRVRHSKPYFMFFKEGQCRAQIEGVDTPRISRTVNDLCKPQNPVTDYVTNADLLQFWRRHFSNEESEVSMTRFMHAIREERTANGLSELTSADIATLAAAVDARGDVVTAAGCQAWVGDDGTVMEHVIELVGAASAPQVNLEPSFVASPSATDAASRGSVIGASRASVSVSRDLQSWREIQPAAVEARGGDDFLSAAPHSAEEQPTEERRTPSISKDAQSWREIHDTLSAAPAPAPAPAPADAAHDQWAELGDEAHQASPVAQQENDQAAAPQEQPAAQPDEWAELGDEEGKEEAAATASSPVLDEEAPAAASPTAVNEEQGSPDGADQWAELGDEEAQAEEWAELGDEEAVTVEVGGETVANQIYVNDQWVRVSDEEMRVWNVVAELPLHYPERDGTMLSPYSEDAVPQLPDSGDAIETLTAYLQDRGANPVEVNMMCLAADQKIGSESVSLGKLALVLMSCNDAVSRQLIAKGEDYYSEVCDGSLLKNNATLGYTALCLCASQAYPDEYFFYIPNQDDMACLEALNEGDEATLAALAPLSTQVAEGTYAVRVVGLPKVIELATTDQRDETMVLSQWYSRLVVAEKTESGITFSFVENIANEQFESFAAAYTARLIEDENRLDKKTGLSAEAPDMPDQEL